MKKTIFKLFLIMVVATLSSCGGGGDGATGPTTSSSSLVITVTPLVNTLPANTLGWPEFDGSPFQTQVNVKVTFANGQDVATGTIVHLQTNNSAVAYIGIPDDPSTQDVNEFAQGYVSVNQETIGATATFYIRSDATSGNVTFTANATDPTTARNYSKTFSFNISQGPDPTVEQLTATMSRTSLPVNVEGTEYFSGTPFMMEVDIAVRDIFGNLTEPALIGTTSGSVNRPVVKVSINPTNILFLTKNDDVATININEFLTEVTPGEIVINAGHGNLFLWSKNVPGIATVTMSTIEPGSGFELNRSFQIEVKPGINIELPTEISLVANTALYTNGSGGASTRVLNYNVKSATFPVADPQVNNIQISLTTDEPTSGEKISSSDVNGNSVEGTTINIASLNGLATAIIHSGTNFNTITLTSTVDNADNNVDNGIQQPISTIDRFIVSDGVLWGLDLTLPHMDTLVVNVENNEDGTINYQDGTYSLIVSAIGTDKAGNPALPQTIQFGMVNSPILGYPEMGAGYFVHSEFDGDPQEGGSGFSSIDGFFLTEAGGVQPNDTLLIFAEESLGNEDLESAVTVASVNSETSLTIVERFNRNDETGTINNSLGVLPYVIGRAVDGNIGATAVLNEVGVATVRLNYPVAALGKVAAIFAKGQGATNNGFTKAVTDVGTLAFPGALDFNGNTMSLTVSPSIIPGNVGNIGISVCIKDSADNPLPGRAITFTYVGGVGVGIIDGQAGTGRLNEYTNLNGCAYGIASTTGILPGVNGHDLGFNFFAGDLTCDLEDSDQTTCLEIAPPQNGVLNANPSAFIGRGTVPIVLTLYDGAGNPIQSAALSGTCQDVGGGGSLAILSGPTVTDVNGQSFVNVRVIMDSPGGGLSGTCTFATASGEPSVDVVFTGGDSCVLLFPSPAAPAGACDITEQFVVGGNVVGLNPGGALVLQKNNTNSININSNTTFLFPPQDDGTVYLVSVSTQPVGQTCTVTNGAGTISANVTDVTVTCL